MNVPPFSQLVYGGPGSGKTYYTTSAFWDHREKKQIREGRLLLMGRESNPALDIPEELIRRFPFDETKPTEASKAFNDYLRKVMLEVRKGKSLGALAVDGFTEFTINFEQGHFDPNDKFKMYDQMKRSLISDIQLMNPTDSGMYILGTARVGEWRKAIESRSTGAKTGGDPEWMDTFKYWPEMPGWAKRNLSHYFNLVNFVDLDIGRRQVLKRGGKAGETVERKVPVHNLYMLGVGNFWVKNCWEEDYISAGQPDYLTNPMFDDVLNVLADL
jgi:hypothetical protein